MLTYYEKNKAKIENQDIDEIAERLLLDLQNKGINPFNSADKK